MSRFVQDDDADPTRGEKLRVVFCELLCEIRCVGPSTLAIGGHAE